MAQDVKTVCGVAIASVKTVAGVAIADVKTIVGVDNTSGGGGGFSLLVEGSKGGDISTVTTDAADTTGATLLVVAAVFYQGTPSLSDSKGNTWQSLTTYAGQTGVAYSVKFFYCLDPVVGSGHTFTLNGSSYNSVIYAGFSKTSPTFDAGKDTGNATELLFTTIQPGSLTPSANDCLLVTCVCWSASGDASIDSSFNLLDQVSNLDVASFRGRLAYKIQTSAGAENPTWTITTGSNSGAAAMAVFK